MKIETLVHSLYERKEKVLLQMIDHSADEEERVRYARRIIDIRNRRVSFNGLEELEVIDSKMGISTLIPDVFSFQTEKGIVQFNRIDHSVIL